VIPYGDRVRLIQSEAALEDFLRLHPAGSSKPRVIVITDDVRRRFLQVFAAAGDLSGSHHFAQIAATRWAIDRFKVRQVPCFVIVDPASRQGHQPQPQLLFDSKSRLKEFVIAARFLPELHQRSFDERCRGEWSGSCAWVAVFVVPPAALGKDDLARRSLRSFRE
ncbi:unnamed protein product, partial [Polarella glacialis]